MIVPAAVPGLAKTAKLVPYWIVASVHLSNVWFGKGCLALRLSQAPDRFEPGFTAKTIVGVLFIAFVMTPGQMYLSLVTGIGIGEAAQWVTVLLFLEIAKRSFTTLRRQEFFLLLDGSPHTTPLLQGLRQAPTGESIGHVEESGSGSSMYIPDGPWTPQIVPIKGISQEMPIFPKLEDDDFGQSFLKELEEFAGRPRLVTDAPLFVRVRAWRPQEVDAVVIHWINSSRMKGRDRDFAPGGAATGGV